MSQQTFIQKTILQVSLIMAILFSSCDKMIYDDLSHCEMGVYVDFYTITAQGDTLTPFPTINPNQQLYLLVFDNQGKLVKTINQQFPLANGQKLFVPIEKAGEYSFVAWYGEPSSFEMFNGLKIGEPKENILAKFTRDSKGVIRASTETIENNYVHIYEGSFLTHAPELGNKYTESSDYGTNTTIFQNPAKYGSQYRHVLIGMKEITNQITITALDAVDLLSDVNDISFRIVGENGDYLYNGELDSNAPTVNYLSTIKVDGSNLVINFPIVGKLHLNQDIKLQISFVQKDGTVFMKEYNLIQLILLDPKYSEETFDFAKHFFLEMGFRYHISAEGIVTDWTAVSKDVVLGN